MYVTLCCRQLSEMEHRISCVLNLVCLNILVNTKRTRACLEQRSCMALNVLSHLLQSLSQTTHALAGCEYVYTQAQACMFTMCTMCMNAWRQILRIRSGFNNISINKFVVLFCASGNFEIRGIAIFEGKGDQNFAHFCSLMKHNLLSLFRASKSHESKLRPVLLAFLHSRSGQIYWRRIHFVPYLAVEVLTCSDLTQGLTE